MIHPHCPAQADERFVSSLFADDLRAQLATLNRYGPNGLAAIIASGLRALTGASRTALCAAAGCGRR